ncbi:FCD domain-containing protein [Ancylobacter dichloromethanicus]
MSKKGEEAEYLRHNRLIHESFFEIADNVTLSAFYQQILTRIHACRFVVRKSREHWAAAVIEHKAMIEALEARDAPRLAELLESHVMGTTAGIARAFIQRTIASAAGQPAPRARRAAAPRAPERPAPAKRWRRLECL